MCSSSAATSRTAGTSSSPSTAPTRRWAGTRQPARSWSTTRYSPTQDQRTPSFRARTQASEARLHPAHRELDTPANVADRASNTLYVGVGNKIQVVYRVYQPDQGCLGDAGAGLPAYTASLADGSELSAEEVRERFNRPLLQGVAPGMPVEQWRALCDAPDNDPELKPQTAPARNPAVLERYFNNKYNLVGVFKPPEVRAKIRTASRPGSAAIRDAVHVGLRIRVFGLCS